MKTGVPNMLQCAKYLALKSFVASIALPDNLKAKLPPALV